MEELLLAQGLTEEQLNDIQLDCTIECNTATKELVFSFGTNNVIVPTRDQATMDFMCDVEFIFDQPYAKKTIPDFIHALISPSLDTTFQVHQYSDFFYGFVLKDFGGYFRIYFNEGDYKMIFVSNSVASSCEVSLRNAEQPITITDHRFHIESSGIYILSISFPFSQGVQMLF